MACWENESYVRFPNLVSEHFIVLRFAGTTIFVLSVGVINS